MTHKSDRHWYPRYPGDYARKTAHLSLVEHGAYALLMDWYYSNAKPLPDDWVQMHRICKAIAPDEQAAVQTIVRQFFTQSDAGWCNGRADEEIQRKAEISDKRRDAQRQREQNRNKQVSKAGAKQDAIVGANAPSNAHTSTSTSTSTVIDTDVSITDIPGSVAVMFDGHFQTLWHAYPGIGKNGVLSDTFKGTKAKAQAAYFQLIIKTKENDREIFIRDIASGARRYAEFLKQSDSISKHLTTWLNDRGWEQSYAIDRPPGNPPQRGPGNGQKPSYSDTVFDAAGAAIDHIRSRDGRRDRPGECEGHSAHDNGLPRLDRIAN